MSLRLRMALLVGAAALIAATIGGVGTVLSSRNVGRDRLDTELTADATRLPSESPRLERQLQFQLETRRVACDEAGVDTALIEVEDEVPPLARPGERRSRVLPEFASSVQLLRPNGVVVAPCTTLPVSEADREIAALGVGRSFRTETVDGERLRILTYGYGEVGAVQYARNLDLTEDTLRGLLGRVIAFSLVGALLGALAGWFAAKRATDPVRRLGLAAERVAQTGDLGERIDVSGDAEIQTLATSFNSMLSSLATSREQQRRLVQDASHELRTPLTSLRTNVEMLRRHPDVDPAVRAEVLGDIGDELSELSALTAELVDSATEIPAQVEIGGVLDLADIAATAVERARRRHEVTLTLTVAEGFESIVRGEEALLNRAVSNLIGNAVKFSGRDNPIEVELRGTTLTVLDRGPGISDEDLPHVFDRFYRATAARTQPGSGLGLAIVAQIVDGHGGTVRAQNRPAGGLAIGFTLPSTDGEYGV